MEKNGVLCTLSEKRLQQIAASPDLVVELMEARHEMEVPGLVDIEDTWDALDFLISARGKEPLLGDAILARSGRPLSGDGAIGNARILTAARVVQVAEGLARLPRDVVRIRFPSLQGKDIYGDYGQTRTAEEREIREVAKSFTRIVTLYTRAAEANHAMLAALV